jgi:hypothetical protein
MVRIEVLDQPQLPYSVRRYPYYEKISVFCSEKIKIVCLRFQWQNETGTRDFILFLKIFIKFKTFLQNGILYGNGTDVTIF